MGWSCAQIEETLFMAGFKRRAAVSDGTLHTCCLQAQQRYRERRKQKFQEMEQTLEQLSSQVEEMQSVKSTNNLLQV